MGHKKKLLWGAGSKYTPLKWLIADGTQYIDTGLVATENDIIEVVAKKSEASDSQRSLFGSRTSATSNTVIMQAGSNGTIMGYFSSSSSYNDYYVTTAASFNASFRIVLSKSRRQIDNLTTQAVDTTNTTAMENSITTPANCYLFAASGSPWATNKWKGGVASLRWIRNGVLLRDMIPVLDEDGVACMYDRANNKLHYNAGTGNFNYEEWDFTPCDYVHTDGDAYINTLAYGDENTGIESCFRSTDGRSQVVIGARTSAQSNAIVIFHPGNANTDTIVMDFGDYRVTRFNQAYFPINNWYFAHNEKSIRWVKDVASGETYSATTEYTDPVVTPNPIYLAYKSSGFAASNNNFIGDYKTAKVFQNGVAVRDMIPVIDDSNTAGMYDKCSNIIFYSVGTSQFEGHFVNGANDYKVVKKITAAQASTSLDTSACAFIKTGIMPRYSKKTRIKYKGSFAVATTSYEHFILGTNCLSRFVIGQTTGSGTNPPNFYFGLGSTNYWTNIAVDTNQHIFELDWETATCSVDGTSFSISSVGTDDSTDDIWLNARHSLSYTNANRPAGGDSVFLKAWEDDKLIYNGISVINSNNVAGIYDTIGKQFQTSAGSVDYTYTE